MIDRTGQAWRKGGARASDIVVLSSTEEVRMHGAQTGKILKRGTNHVIIRYIFKERTFEHQTWYEFESDPWESRDDFTRTA